MKNQLRNLCWGEPKFPLFSGSQTLHAAGSEREKDGVGREVSVPLPQFL
jgi:hypothetical protein